MFKNMKIVAVELAESDQKPTHGNVYMNPNIFMHNDDNQRIIFGPIKKIAKTTKKSFSYKTKIIFDDVTFFIDEFTNIGDTCVICKIYIKKIENWFSNIRIEINFFLKKSFILRNGICYGFLWRGWL